MSGIAAVGYLMTGMMTGVFMTGIFIEMLNCWNEGPAEEDTRDWQTPCELCKHGPPKNRRPCITCPAEREWK